MDNENAKPAAQGRQEFSPEPRETQRLVRSAYGVRPIFFFCQLLAFFGFSFPLIAIHMLRSISQSQSMHVFSQELQVRYGSSLDSISQASALRIFFSGVPRNLLIRFASDTIDETEVLRGVLSTGSAVSASLDLTLRELPGDHVRPLQQVTAHFWVWGVGFRVGGLIRQCLRLGRGSTAAQQRDESCA